MATRANFQDLIDAIQDNTPNTAAEVRNILNALADSIHLTGDVKEIDVSNAYLAANFDSTGLGINERAGWVICNGLNATRNRGGRVSIGYSTTYSTLGATGGFEDAVVVNHHHGAGVYNNGQGTPIFTNVGLNEGSDTMYSETYNTGESGVGKNMQPYIVSLYIMKL